MKSLCFLTDDSFADFNHLEVYLWFFWLIIDFLHLYFALYRIWLLGALWENVPYSSPTLQKSTSAGVGLAGLLLKREEVISNIN